MYHVRQIEKSIYGLKYRPSIEPERDDNTDFYGEFYRPVPREFSAENQKILKEALLSLPKPRCIVEIGVQRNPLPESSTGILLEHKPTDCTYIGIDIEDKSHLVDREKNVHILKMDSAKRNETYELVHQLGLKYIDLLFIDGWHSVNQCLEDWQYVKKLAPNGVVVMHDTNVHPGPVTVFEAIDEKIFEKRKYCKGDADWGIAVIRQKK